MKALLLIAAGITFMILVASGPAKSGGPGETEFGITFHAGTWNQALDQAKKENKLIFLDVYASWCRPCKKLKANTFADSQVGDYFNKSFINVELDGEKGEGAALAKKYGVRAYPTLLFLNSEGEIVARKVGYHNPKQFLELGHSIIQN